MQTVPNPSLHCCEHAERCAELAAYVEELRRALLVLAGKAFDPLPGDPASGARLRAVS
jgi:hypothetical protein